MARAAREGYETLLHTGDGQLSDAIVDRHFLEAFYHQCKNSPDEVLRQYGTAFVVFANLRIAIAKLVPRDAPFLFWNMPWLP